MGCGGSKDEVRKIEIKSNKKDDEDRHKSEKEIAINSIFSKNNEDDGEILVMESDRSSRKEFVRPKLNLVKRQGPTERNVNLLIEDNTKVFELQ